VGLLDVEIQVNNLDENVMRIGSKLFDGQPIGEWPDMDGRRWLSENAGWNRAKDKD
jgi:hypothetical protein